jgi:hypothetical protein
MMKKEHEAAPCQMITLEPLPGGGSRQIRCDRPAWAVRRWDRRVTSAAVPGKCGTSFTYYCTEHGGPTSPVDLTDGTPNPGPFKRAK